jgi:hypothetical protein
LSFEDILPSEDLSKTCVVCGKSLHPGEALATMHHGEAKLPIRCPRGLVLSSAAFTGLYYPRSDCWDKRLRRDCWKL